MNKDTLTEMGVRLAQEGKIKKAREFFERALDEDPDEPIVWNNLGNSYAQEGEYEKAIPYLPELWSWIPTILQPGVIMEGCIWRSVSLKKLSRISRKR